MFSLKGHTGIVSVDGCAIMTQHFAQKCTGEAEQAIMSEHFAQKSSCAQIPQRYYRYW
ncbi:hypothetical protein [Adlercreutzia sp. ZJ242]|uniref:hypothetical protein n=1 Tax=Adlercreutzia sp. ZJ242 TaxID=2709409 RepID=UPI0013ED87A9|nr:hypothetical protein [Adlercreutzia sp. ZJ242]